MRDKLENLHFKVASHACKKGGYWHEPVGVDHLMSLLKGLEK